MVFYRLFIWLYPKVAWLLSFSNQKAKKWLEGRKGVFKKLSIEFHNNQAPVIWMHTASLGEFEQGLPVLERLKRDYPGYRILLTFFSPSGFEVRKNYSGVDTIFYLPMDSPSNATRFLNIVQPSLILFVKYEFWYFYLQEAKNRSIPLLLVSGIFRKNQPFFSWYGGLYRKMLSFYHCLFLQNPLSVQLLQSIGIKEKFILSGDTRFDRVISIFQQFTPIPLINEFCNNQTTIVAGSTWTEDDEELDHFANTHPLIKFIIAPHDIDEERLKECQLLYKNSIFYSEYENLIFTGGLPSNNINVLIIDNVGLLSKLYYYATICYVGGGFGDDGIHNILEPAVFGKPVIFGPVYDKYLEAGKLIECGGGFSIDNALELEGLIIQLLENKELLQKAGESSGIYVKSNAGSTNHVMKYIQENRLLIN